MSSRPKILVADKLDKEGLAILAQAGEVIERTDMSREELLAAVAEVDAIVVRSGTRVTAEVIEAAPRLRVIARAGVGTDNIDVEAATRKGVVVVNSPAGNTLAAAEYTIAMMLAIARKIPQADASTRAGNWDRRSFMGRQLYGKTLGVIGFGRIGRAVSQRALAFGMTVLAHDPYVAPAVMEEMGVQPTPFDELLARADFVTLHADLRDENRHMIAEPQLRQMKKEAFLINCARGGLIDEQALIQALKEGWIAGAALDVFETEPRPNPELLALPNVVVTPHLGASTVEAQAQVAVDAAEQVVSVLAGRAARWAVNAPALPPEAEKEIAPYLELASALGTMAAALCDGLLPSFLISGPDHLSDQYLELAARFAAARYLATGTGNEVNYVNVTLVADEHGMKIDSGRGDGPEGYRQWLTLLLSDGSRAVRLAGVLVGGLPRIVEVDGFGIDLVPRGRVLCIWHGAPGRPGFIGRVGTILGDRGISITGIEVGIEPMGGVGFMAVQVEQDLSHDVLEEIRGISDV
ncbi:MAG: phosphoglycerate dehydrogenase, partial [Armatimonadetes bacterium]|nr:phosphoglycerate dehydrogenase [Armatimonadota bacterium]